MKTLTDNSDPVAKKMIRQWLIEEMGGANNTKVLELFGGMGHIHDDCYVDPPVAAHMAFEKRKVNRPTWLQGDNRTLLQGRVNGWNLYDLDAYASPWRLANDICRMREDGVFSMALTCGIYRALNAGTVEAFISQRIGLMGLGWNVGIITRWYPNIVEWLMLDWQRWGVEVIAAKHIGSLGSHLIHYFGVTVKKDSSKAIEPMPLASTKPTKAPASPEKALILPPTKKAKHIVFKKPLAPSK